MITLLCVTMAGIQVQDKRNKSALMPLSTEQKLGRTETAHASSAQVATQENPLNSD